MRGGTLHRVPRAHSSKPLVIRGGLARTFGSLAGFLAITFLCWGIYLLADALVHPLLAGAAALIVAAFIIAIAVILLFYLVKPRNRVRAHGRQHRMPSAEHFAPEKHRVAQGPNEPDTDSVYQHLSVDHSRIRP